MPRYEDYLGGFVERPSTAVIDWRISCYAIVVRDERLLMVRPAWAERWELPGGGVELELEETLLEASIRECREETGYLFTPIPASLMLLTDGFFSISSSERFFHSLTFTVEGKVSDAPIPRWQKDSTEIVDIRWLNVKELNGSTIHTPHRTALIQRGLLTV